MYVMEFKTK